MRMPKTLLVLGLGVALAGCSSSGELDNPFASDNGAQNARLAAYAASSKYPSTRPSNDLRAAAMINRDSGAIRVVNFSDRALRNVNVWVNGSFVHQVDNIPANGTVSLARNQFYDASGRTLASQNTTPVTVQVETQDGFYNLQGPVLE